MSEQPEAPSDTNPPMRSSVSSEDASSVSTTSTRPATLAKPSGLKPPMKIGRLCSNSAPKPAIPLSPRTVKENSATIRKYDSILNNEQFKGLFSKNYSSDNLNNNEDCNENDKFSTANENKDVENESSFSSDLHNMKNADNVQDEASNECTFDKELDKRNYYFGNLLIGELQFWPPCMRSEAYVTILKYVDSLKQLHRKRHNT